MSQEELRKIIVDKQRAVVKSGEPGPHAIANFLTAFGRDIFSSEDTYMIEMLLKGFNYKKIEDLRTDARQLMMELRAELDEDDWKKYFERL